MYIVYVDVHVGHHSAHTQLYSLSMQDLFFKFPWNNFLHSQVEGCVSAAVSTTVPVAPGDGNSTETNESTDDSFSLKYHVSHYHTKYACTNVHIHIYMYNVRLHAYIYMYMYTM